MGVRLRVIGLGVNGRKSIGQEALSFILEAGLLVGGSRHLSEFPDATGERLAITADIEGLKEAIRRYIKKGKKDAAILATGDPLLFGIAELMIRSFGKRVEVLPNVSVVQEAAARLQLPLNGVKVLSAHGSSRSIDEVALDILSTVKTAVFTDSVNTPAKIALNLLSRGALDYKAYVCESLGLKGERLYEGTLEDISRIKRFSQLNVAFFVRNSPIAPRRLGSIPDCEFRHKGLITKAEVRAVSISKLNLTDKSVVWDIGAGCGSVAIEAALMAPFCRVVAFEKDPGRVKDIKANVKKFKAANVSVVEGVAPAIFKRKDFGAPDAVFIGGGGSGINAILKSVAGLSVKGASIVVNAVTLDTAHATVDFFKKAGWGFEAALVSVSKTKELAGLSMFKASNPIFIIQGIKA